jgi:hypothetical protein
MANGYLGFQNPGTENKKIDTEELTVGGQTVQRERVQVAGAADVEIAAVKNTVPISTDYGLVVREAGVNVVNPNSGDQTPSGAMSVAALLFGHDGANWDQSRVLWSESDGIGSFLANASTAIKLLYNGVNFDRERGNVPGQALASGARTVTTYSADINIYNARGIILVLNASAKADTPSITMAVQGKDSESSNYFDLTGETGALTDVGMKFLAVYPGAVDTDTKGKAVGLPLPKTIRVRITHADADSITYSVGYTLVI